MKRRLSEATNQILFVFIVSFILNKNIHREKKEAFLHVSIRNVLGRNIIEKERASIRHGR
jgi:hypothetical protein